MKLSTTYSGDSWAHVRKQLGAACEAVNGQTTTGWPGVSNAQALAILQAFRKLLRSNKETVPAALWPECWYLALGRLKPGDKFIMSTAHGSSPASLDVVECTWALVVYATERLEAKRAKPILLVLDLSYRGYEQAAKDAYAQLKRDTAKNGKAPPIPPLPDKPPIDPPLPVVPRPKFRDAGILLLLLVVAFGSTRRRR